MCDHEKEEVVVDVIRNEDVRLFEKVTALMCGECNAYYVNEERII